MITISDFNKAADGITVSDGVTTGGGRQTIVTSVLDNIKNSATSVLDAANKAAAVTDVNMVSVFDYAGDAYILVNSGNQAFEAGDTLIKVTGVASTDLTSTNFAVI